MAGKDATESDAGDQEDGIRETLATIQEQSRQTLELLRTLIGRHRQVGREQAWWEPSWSGKRAG